MGGREQTKSRREFTPGTQQQIVSLEDTKLLMYKSWTIEGELEKMGNKRWEGKHELCITIGPDNIAPTKFQ